MAAYCIGAPAHLFPNKTALTVLHDTKGTAPRETWTFAELDHAVRATAAGLKALGLEAGARIVIRLDNTSDYALLFFAALAGGFVPLPTTTALTDKEAGFLIEDSGASLLCLADGLEPGPLTTGVRVLDARAVSALREGQAPIDYAPVNANDPAYLVYTSGTTSKPKGVMHAHRVAFGRQPIYQGWYGISSSDRMLHAGAFNWTYTLGTGLIDPWANGAEAIVFTGDKRPEIWPSLIRDTGATLFAAVPGVYRQILKYAGEGPIDVGTLRHGLIAGEGPPADLFDAWHARTGTHLLEALGMSEISTYISTAPGMARKPGSAGKAQTGRRVAVLPVEGGTTPLPANTEGLLAVHRSDPGLMLGYWNRKEEEQDVYRDDWFIGGDLALIDDDGYVIHKGRANDVMKALGYRVSPSEVEKGLLDHPGIIDVACTEVQVRADVSVIGAFVVAATDPAPTKESILAHAESNLAAYKRPREIVFVDALPRTRNGKVQRSALQDIYHQQQKTG